MKFKRLLKKKSTRLVLGLIVFVVLLFLLAQLARKLSAPVVNYLTTDNQPAFIIQSNIPVQSELYFNNELGTSIFSDKIIGEINQAQQSLEIAVYSLKSPRIKEAIYAAAARGVEVSLIMDFRKKEIHDQFFFDLPSSIKRLDFGSDEGGKTILMHHKFAIIDRGQATQKLIFGSYNWTELQEKFDPSFIFISANSELITSFGREFDRLARGESGPDKLKSLGYNPWDLSLSASGFQYEVWFGPGVVGNNLNNRIYTLLRDAKQEVKIMIWDFTDKGLAEEIINRARAGVKVKIITDNRSFSNQASVFPLLQEAKIRYKLANLEIISDEVRGEEAIAFVASSSDPAITEALDPFLHYHVLIVDNQKIFFGTNNWSRAGAYNNDESAIVSNDPDIINQFSQSFEENYGLNRKR